MKKTFLLPGICVLSVMVFACHQAAGGADIKKGFGTVYLNIGGTSAAARAVDANGLPEFKDAAMSLEINSPEKGMQRQDFTAGEEKTWSGTFPVGEKITVKVTLSTAIAEWKGAAEHTVTEGDNSVGVKLDTKAVRLENLLFNCISDSNQAYTFMLKTDKKEIIQSVAVQEPPFFCRDNKGRTYFAYKSNNSATSPWVIERYTGEGNKENAKISLSGRTSKVILASDYTEGNVYAYVKDINPQIKRIKKTGTVMEPLSMSGSSLAVIENMAVYGNILISYERSGNSMTGLSMYRINGTRLEKAGSYSNIGQDTRIDLSPAGTVHGTINELYMTSDSLYVLFSALNKSGSGCYSLGGIVKYSYTADGTISNPKRIGIKENHTAQNGIYATDDNNFYGPVKVVGFDAENLYIADDGVSFEKTDSGVIVKANHDRIAAFNIKTEAVSFNKAPDGIKWQTDEKVTGTGTVDITIGFED